MYAEKLIRFLKRQVLPRRSHYWEYYGRLKFASDQILSHHLDQYTVLDVGGATGNNLLEKFGVKNVTTLDVKEGADIVASAAQIPVQDNSFDFVTSLDMMEHVRQDLRSKVVDEMIRVSKICVAIIAPIKSPENMWAEDLVLSYRHADFLQEHKEQGLVDFDQIENQLNHLKSLRKISAFRKAELDNLQTWVSLMTEDFCDSSEVYAKCYERLENRFVPRRIALVISK